MFRKKNIKKLNNERVVPIIHCLSPQNPVCLLYENGSGPCKYFFVKWPDVKAVTLCQQSAPGLLNDLLQLGFSRTRLLKFVTASNPVTNSSSQHLPSGNSAAECLQWTPLWPLEPQFLCMWWAESAYKPTFSQNEWFLANEWFGKSVDTPKLPYFFVGITLQYIFPQYFLMGLKSGHPLWQWTW